MKLLRAFLCWLRHGGEHDFEVEFEGQARVEVLRCKGCDHRSVGWG